MIETVEDAYNALVKYIDENVKEPKKSIYLHEIATINPPPVRGIFSEMKSDGIDVKKCDREIVHGIFYYFG